MIDETSTDMKPQLNKEFQIKDFQALDQYVNQHFSVEEKAKLNQPKYFYQLDFEKLGGLVMPILVELTFEDGTKETHKFPAQIWRMNDKEVSRTFATKKQISKIVIDPQEETADVDPTNNVWPKQEIKSKFE
jgi:hypothetical protein